jgi:hypothetical protein
LSYRRATRRLGETAKSSEVGSLLASKAKAGLTSVDGINTCGVSAGQFASFHVRFEYSIYGSLQLTVFHAPGSIPGSSTKEYAVS